MTKPPLINQFLPFNISAVYYEVIRKMGCKHNEKIDLTKFPAKLGVTLELCAGIVDKNLPLKQVAKEEVLEECGFNVSLDNIEEVMSNKYATNIKWKQRFAFVNDDNLSQFRSGVGTSGAEMTMFYCEVTDADKVTGGGGIDGRFEHF